MPSSIVASPFRALVARGAVPFIVALIATSALPALTARGQTPRQTLHLSLAEAVEAALVRSYAVRLAAADSETSEAQIQAAYASLLPNLDARVSYQRTFLTPNPFAGSDAADLFTGANTQDWLAFNERVDRGGDGLAEADVLAACPEAFPGGALRTLGFAEYAGCVGRAQESVRLGPAPEPGSNPFLVENTVRAGLSASQLLYSGAAFAGLRAAAKANELSEAQLARAAQTVAERVVEAYYAVLLAEAGVEVLAKSVERTLDTVQEVQSRLKEGVVPRFQVLSAEVELANLETELVTARDRAAVARDRLALTIGVPVGQPLVLTDGLELPEQRRPFPEDVDAAMAIALQTRPDLRAARSTVELRRAAEDATFARYLPELRLVADLTAVGTIPDDRSRTFAAPNPDSMVLLPQNPFAFRAEDRGIFDDAFWGTNLTAGLNLTWNLFDGFGTTAQRRQDALDVKRARIQQEQLEDSVRLEVAEERRRVMSALERVGVQEKNVERAELNYRHAELRVQEGVSTQLELREASQQLDQSRLNRLQAVHDYLVARSSFEVAVGRPPLAGDGDPQ